MTKERIEIIRQSLIPFVKKELLEINNDGLGKSDAKEFEKDLNEVLDMAINVLEQQPSDYVSMGVYKQVAWERDAAIEQLNELGYSFGEKIRTSDDCVSRQAVLDLMQLKMGGKELYKAVYDLPPVTPTHGICKDCKHYYMDEDGCGYHCERVDYTRFSVYADFYCKEFEKRGNEDGSN